MIFEKLRAITAEWLINHRKIEYILEKVYASNLKL